MTKVMFLWPWELVTRNDHLGANYSLEEDITTAFFLKKCTNKNELKNRNDDKK